MRPTEIPIVDVAALRRPQAGDLLRIADEIRTVSVAVGFFYIAGHGVDAALVADIFEANRRFHALPVAEKAKVRQNRWHRGWMGLGDAELRSSEKFAPARRPNRMESFMLRHELGPDHPDVIAGKPLQGPNQWPADAWICDAMRRYDASIRDLGLRLLPVLSLAVGEAVDFLPRFFAPPSTALRLIHYPPTPVDRPEDLFGSHPHTDYGFLTILAQDDVGGLQVQSMAGDWIDAPSIPGMFLCNIGDAFSRWTNDVFRSTPHRVINASTERDRYSVAYFFDPNLDATIACLPGFAGERSAKWPPVRFGDYYAGRLDANFARYDGSSRVG